jgi:hypothetical protein
VTYVSKSTRRAPLLTPSRPNSYQEAIALETGLGIATETQNNTDKNPCETDDKNRIKNQLKTSQIFHRPSYAWGTTAKKRFRLEKLDHFLSGGSKIQRQLLQQSTPKTVEFAPTESQDFAHEAATEQKKRNENWSLSAHELLVTVATT